MEDHMPLVLTNPFVESSLFHETFFIIFFAPREGRFLQRRRISRFPEPGHSHSRPFLWEARFFESENTRDNFTENE